MTCYLNVHLAVVHIGAAHVRHLEPVDAHHLVVVALRVEVHGEVNEAIGVALEPSRGVQFIERVTEDGRTGPVCLLVVRAARGDEHGHGEHLVHLGTAKSGERGRVCLGQDDGWTVGDAEIICDEMSYPYTMDESLTKFFR